MMSMKFDLVKFIHDLGAQFNTEDDLEAYKLKIQEALRPFRIAVAGPNTLHAIMDSVINATRTAYAEGQLHAPDGIAVDKLDRNPKVYIDWVGTTRENTGRVAKVNPIAIHELFHLTMLRYFQTQFDAGGWEVEKAQDSPKIVVTLPGEVWTFKMEMTKEVLPH